MRFSLALLSALAAVSNGWRLTGYETDEECNVSTGRYRIMESTDDPSEDCQRFGYPNEHLTCAQYENGGVEGPNDCGAAIWNPRSVLVEGTTLQDEQCYSCKLFSDDHCGNEWKDTAKDGEGCYELGLGAKSFICKHDEWAC